MNKKLYHTPDSNFEPVSLWLNKDSTKTAPLHQQSTVDLVANLTNRYNALCWRPVTHAQTWASYSALYRFGILSYPALPAGPLWAYLHHYRWWCMILQNSVCPSVTRDKTVEKLHRWSTSRTCTLVAVRYYSVSELAPCWKKNKKKRRRSKIIQPGFLRKRMVGRGIRCTWNFGSTGPRWSKIADFEPIIACSTSAVTPSEKSSINTNRKSTTCFPMSLRWSSYVAPISPPKGA